MGRASEPVGGFTAATTDAIVGQDPYRVGISDRPDAPGLRMPGGAHGHGRGPYRRRRSTIVTLFLGPALVIVAILVIWPIVRTVWLSFHDATGTHWVGLHNYANMLTLSGTRKAIENNLIWVLVAPAVTTVLGLIFAVLTERVKLATAFKTVLFMPMAISFLAAGVTWRLVYDASPDRGVLNAIVVMIHDTFEPASPYPGVRPRTGTLLADGPHGAFDLRAPATAGTPVAVPLVGMPVDQLPSGALAAAPAVGSGLTGVVWLDFHPGGTGRDNVIDPGERGLPGISVQAMRDGRVVATTTTDGSGAFRFAGLTDGGYTIRLPGSNFAAPYGGINWLGPDLVTPAIILSYLWIWAGFAMVVISAGLAALPRDALEAARVDGATEWQVFRLITVPLVRPVLTVVLITLVINVLKIFDLVYVIAPSESAASANVVAVQMYQVVFGGGQDIGLGSALGVLLLFLVIPAMLFNLRRLRRHQP